VFAERRVFKEVEILYWCFVVLDFRVCCGSHSCILCFLLVFYRARSVEEVVEEVVEEEEEAMTMEDAIRGVLKTSLIADGLARGLKECVKAIDRREAHLCIMAESCDNQEYKKLIKALCEEYKVRLLEGVVRAGCEMAFRHRCVYVLGRAWVVATWHLMFFSRINQRNLFERHNF
jgi:hypothetical protein